MANKPFEGLKVLEFCWAGVGAYVVNYLAYYGATVIKIENASFPDIVRNFAPYKDGIPGLERSAYFLYTHPAKKHSVSLNLKNPKAEPIKKKLIEWADVVVDNFAAGTLDKWGFGYEQLKKIKPDIIAFHACLYGHGGPLSSVSGTGLDLTTLSGFNSIAGWPDRLPTPISSYYTDNIAPLFGAFALVAALDYKRKTGKGQFLDMAQLETGAHFLAPLVLDSAVNQRELERNGNKVTYAAPHGAYRCKGEDRWCAISASTDGEWQSFCQVIGNPEWTRAEKYSTLAKRVDNSEELDRLINQWTSNFTAEKVMSMMQAAGVAAGVLLDAKDQTEDPQVKYYQHFVERDHPVVGKLSFYHPRGFRLSDTPAEVERAPLLGEHTEYIYTQVLGFSKEEFARLRQEGVCD